MLLFPQVGEDQVPPVALQYLVGTAVREYEAAPSREGFHEKMHLRVMPEGLIVPDPFHRISDGLPVEHTAHVEGTLHAEALAYD